MTRTMTCAIGMLLACGTACGVRGDNGHPERQLVLRDSTDWSNGKGSTRRLQLVNVSDRPILDVLKDELIEELLGRGCTLLLEPSLCHAASATHVPCTCVTHVPWANRYSRKGVVRLRGSVLRLPAPFRATSPFRKAS
jgi:hypothetical protein